MKQVLIRRGAAVVEDVPAPHPGPGEVLVRVAASCLSVGTELNSVRSSGVPIWRRALQQPEKVVNTLKMAVDVGIGRTWNLVKEKRDAASPTGYSAAGIVVRVGEDIRDIVPGDRVACAGGGYAVHAEFIRVPRNLCSRLPESLGWEDASTVTLGAIALQGVRRSAATLGEIFVVVGLGILGQLTSQLLKANGCRVIGIDLNRDRIELAQRLGADVALPPDDGCDIEQVARLTDGNGADGVIITAATPSDAVVSAAFRMCRKKGRVVLVGDVGLNLRRDDFYAKEIDFFISTSYGPGRYDQRYEEQGFDYPLAYVRWTENRNMGEYLRLLSEGRVQVQPLVSGRYAVADAAAAYASLSNGTPGPLMVLLTYPDTDQEPTSRLRYKPNTATAPGKIRVAVLGAGGFARSAHLPNLHSMSDRFVLQAVVTQSGHSGTETARQFGAAYASTNYEEVLADPDVDAVVIATRHHLHATMALAALRAGKHVLVEKPMALQDREIDELDAFMRGANEHPVPVFLTGYNRRFSSYAQRLAQLIRGRSGPFIFNYRMNAGYLPSEHWVHGPEGGGRNLGEACHIYDLFTYLANAEVTEVSAHAIAPASSHYSRTDNFVATVTFAEGSVATLTYTALGHPGKPKELADLYVDGKVASLGDYRQLDILGVGGRSLKTPTQDKGLKAELFAFADAVNAGSPAIPWWQQLQVARIALLIDNQLLGRVG